MNNQEPIFIPEPQNASEEKFHDYFFFSNEALSIMKDHYKKNKYPNRQEIQSLASKLSEKELRIQNWFRAQRQKQFNSRTLKHDKKHVFSSSEITVLKELYAKSKYPTRQAYLQTAKTLNIKPKNIRNWFCYKRKIDRIQNKEAKSPEILQSGSNVSTEMTINNQPLQNNCFMRNSQNTLSSSQIFPNTVIPPNFLMPINNQINVPLLANMRCFMQNPLMPINTQIPMYTNMRNPMQYIMPIQNNQLNLSVTDNIRAAMQNMRYPNFTMPTTMQRPILPFNGYNSFNF